MKKQLNNNQREKFNGEIQAIFKGGKINSINWGADSEKSGWNAWTTEQRLTYSMELASAMNQAADIMQKERNALLDKVDILKKELKSSNEALVISKTIMTNTIIDSNSKQESYANDVRELQKEIAVLKAFKDANINQ